MLCSTEPEYLRRQKITGLIEEGGHEIVGNDTWYRYLGSCGRQQSQVLIIEINKNECISVKLPVQ